MVVQRNNEKSGFIAVLGGGTGMSLCRRWADHRRSWRTHSVRILGMDTDPRARADLVEMSDGDSFLSLALSADAIRVLRANAENFGPAVEAIVEHHARWLDPEDASQGSRAVRLLTELAYYYHLPSIKESFKDGVKSLLKEGNCDSIQPILIGSSGGGCGSALVPLIAHLLQDPEFRKERLLDGRDAIIRRPIALCPDPLAYLDHMPEGNARKIKANIMAQRIEMAEHPDDYKYVHHLGIANRTGVVLDQREEIASVLALNVHLLTTFWPEIKATFVNYADETAYDPYLGVDTLEIARSRLMTLNGHN